MCVQALLNRPFFYLYLSCVCAEENTFKNTLIVEVLTSNIEKEEGYKNSFLFCLREVENGDYIFKFNWTYYNSIFYQNREGEKKKKKEVFFYIIIIHKQHVYVYVC